MIRIEGLHRRFGDFVAVRNIDLEVAAGEVLGFLGPNGAGKTTTIKMITGLLRPTAGRVQIAGHDMTTEPLLAKAHLAYVPDKPFVYDKLTGLDLVRFVGSLYGMDPGEATARGRDLFRLFRMADRGDELIGTYSHGIRQKALFAAALVHRPSAFVVDEPMVGLDPRSARLVRKIFRALARAGVAVLLSTHTMDVAEAVCDRIAIIHKGEIVALGPMEALRRMTQNRTDGRADVALRLEEVFLRLTEEDETQLERGGLLYDGQA